jgi:hypothetical protein
VPFYEPDVFDPAEQQEWMRDRAASLRSRAADDAFDVATGLLKSEVARAVGFVPRPEDSAADMLRSLCVRCHAAGLDPSLRRSGFDAEAAVFAPAIARAIRTRLSLPKSSPALMPPRRVGELPDWAIQRLDDFLRERCSEPGSCD